MRCTMYKVLVSPYLLLCGNVRVYIQEKWENLQGKNKTEISSVSSM